MPTIITRRRLRDLEGKAADLAELRKENAELTARINAAARLAGDLVNGRVVVRDFADIEIQPSGVSLAKRGAR